MTIHADGYLIHASGRPKVSNPVPIGFGYTLCDYAGQPLKTNFDLSHSGSDLNKAAPVAGLVLLAEIWGVVEALLLAHPGDTVVCDNTETVDIFSRGNMSKFIHEADQILFLRLKMKMIRQGIKVEWRGREANTAGRYNENVIRRGLKPTCECNHIHE